MSILKACARLGICSVAGCTSPASTQSFRRTSRTPTLKAYPPYFEKRIDRRSNRTAIGTRFTDPVVRTSVEVDGALMDAIHEQILAIERQINAQVPEHDPVAVHLLRSIPGVGKTLALVILYEIHDINRFPAVGNFISYARLVKCTHESAGKRKTGPNNKTGNVYLKWAFSEAACLFLRRNERGKIYHQRLVAGMAKPKHCPFSLRNSGAL